jgi:hypothetical protein
MVTDSGMWWNPVRMAEDMMRRATERQVGPSSGVFTRENFQALVDEINNQPLFPGGINYFPSGLQLLDVRTTGLHYETGEPLQEGQAVISMAYTPAAPISFIKVDIVLSDPLPPVPLIDLSWDDE